MDAKLNIVPFVSVDHMMTLVLTRSASNAS